MRALLVVLTLALLVDAARAERIAVESYGQANRPPVAARLVPPLLAELERAGFVVGNDVGTRYEETVSRPARSSRFALPSDFDARVQRGYRQMVRGDFTGAMDTLTPLVDAARANPAVVANDQSVRENLRLALVALAMSQKRSNDPVATRAAPETLQDLVRSYPDLPVTVDDFGPEPTAWYEEVRKAMGKEGRGTLVVSADDASAMLYLNEKFEAPRKFTKAQLLPGRYRLYVRWGSQDGRVYVAHVRAGKTTTLAIERRLDRALRTSGAWIGFAFASDAEREAHEVALAAKVAQQLQAEAVAVVGVGARGGSPSLFALLVPAATARVAVTETTALAPEPAAPRLQAMARAIATAKPAKPADRPTKPAEPPAGGSAAVEPAGVAGSVEGHVEGRVEVSAQAGLGEVALVSATGGIAVSGLAGVAAAATLYRTSWCDCDGRAWRNTAAAVGIGVTASVLHGVVSDRSAYSLLPTMGPTTRWAVAGVSAAAVLGGATMIALDRHPVDDPKDLLAPGSALAVLGGLGVGAALSQFLHQPAGPAATELAPAVAITGDSAWVGVAGGF